MGLNEIIDGYITVAILTLSLFGVNQLLARKTHRSVYRWLAAFLLVNALTEVPNLLELTLSKPGEPSQLVHVLWSLSLPLFLIMPPLLWFYVRAITAGAELGSRHRLAVHYLPALASLILPVILLRTPWQNLVAASQSQDPMGVPVVIQLNIVLAIFVGIFLVQCGVYTGLIVKRLASYRSQLKDLFSSTEEQEMRWVRRIGVFLVCYVVSSFVVHMVVFKIIGVSSNLEPAVELLPDLFGFLLVWTLVAWGLRQRPALAAEPGGLGSHEKSAAGKYERSALPPERARRIADKIDAMMREKNLYRDANLSLRALSDALGVSPNYVSQTLNTTLDSTFFDYVNAWRIEEAKQRLAEGDDTILAVAYDVGFNSRSSFYESFRRNTGMTPSRYREQAISACEAVATDS